MDVAIIGGGPAGIFAAFEAAKRNLDVVLIDSNPFLGRKLSSTGGGRGNLTNINVTPSSYYSWENGTPPPFADLINNYNYHFLHEYFESLGLYLYHTDDGWCYPISNSAKNTAEFFAELLSDKRVKILNNTYVRNITYENGEYFLDLKDMDTLRLYKLIIATGGNAYPQLGSSVNLLNSLRAMGHKTIQVSPALAPILTSKDTSKYLSGVRLDAHVSILEKGKILGKCFGNIIFTDWGINGPGAMNISHHLNNSASEYSIEIDCIHNNKDRIVRTLNNYRNHKIRVISILNIFFSRKLSLQILKNARINPNVMISQLSNKEIDLVIRHFLIREKSSGTKGFKFSQLSTGGVSYQSVKPKTLESALYPGLYFAGEVLDIMGPCGGYNLHWAFISGIICGRNV